MTGKILKVSSNDLYGKADERKVAVYACFEHTKYMNNYVIFSFYDETIKEVDKKKLCYGSIHLKKDAIVIFSVREEIKQYIDKFNTGYLDNKLDDFKIINLDKITKVEIVSYNEMEYDRIELIVDKSLPKPDNKEEEVVVKKKPVFLYILIFILVLSSIGLTLLYFKPDLFTIKYKELICNNRLYDQDLGLYYDIKKDVKFTKNDKVESNNNIKTYTFKDIDSYNEFKDNNKQEVYFNNGSYKYIDEELKLRLFQTETGIIDDYDEMLNYLKREGYSCKESEYEK